MLHIHTKDKLVGEQGSESDEQTAETTAHVCELGSLARPRESRVVGVPIHHRWGRGVVKGMVRERVSVCTLSVVAFL